MYAIIKHGGKQYKVKEGDILELDRMDADINSEVEINEVLLIKGDELKIGRPFVENAKVILQVLAHTRGKKIIIFKKRRRKDSKTKKGFRRDLTRVKVKEIKE